MTLEQQLGADALHQFQSMDTPQKIQAFLDSIPYSPDDLNRTRLEVLHDRTAHCLDGALFAAAALRRIGHPALVVDLLPEPGLDDDHMLAVYRVDGLMGAIAKSNFAGLRFREAIHRSVRELTLSYFEDFFNVNGVKTLRAYTAPIDLPLRCLGWHERGNAIGKSAPQRYPHWRCCARGLAVDPELHAGMLGIIPMASTTTT
jgi:hypothetical protein